VGDSNNVILRLCDAVDQRHFTFVWRCWPVVWDVNSTVTKCSDYFVWKDTSERVTRRWGNTSRQEASEFLCIKTPPFLRKVSNKKSAQNPRKCSLRRATNVTFSKTVLIDQLIRGQRFWEVVCFTVRAPGGYTLRGFTFEPRTGGELRIFGFYTKKQTNKQTI